MQSGVYRKLSGHTGVGMFYQFVLVSRNHDDGKERVIYMPLRIEPEWGGSARFCDIERERFEAKFEYVGERLPEIICPKCFREGERNPEADTNPAIWKYWCRYDGHGWDTLPELRP